MITNHADGRSNRPGEASFRGLAEWLRQQVANLSSSNGRVSSILTPSAKQELTDP